MWSFNVQPLRTRATMLSGILVVTLAVVHADFRDCRAESARPSKSALEAKIVAALDEPTELDFAEQPLSDAIEYIKQRHKIEVQFDEKALADAGCATDTPITRSIKGVSLESALDLVLSEIDLTWIIHDEVLFITSKAQADEIIETRVYPVRDLVTPPGKGFTDDSDFDALVEVLTEAAASKESTPDPRSIHVFRPAGVLVITRPVVVHRRIEKLLKELRRAMADGGA
ncbi:MAG TPA: hypothetical protein PK867_01960 [Pirellulales bacterium]|nr:hypothetical protein [Pirellulales bacterium]